MKKTVNPLFIRSVIFTAMLSIFPMTSFAGKFEDGLAAYNQENYSAALKLWRPLAEHGDASGQFQLANMYFDGIGVPQNYVEAAKWCHKAADQGDAVAQVMLGEMYEDGKGFPQDYAKAYMWLNLAASQYPSVYTKRRDNLVNSMTPKQIAEGQKLSLEWKPKKIK